MLNFHEGKQLNLNTGVYLFKIKTIAYKKKKNGL